MQKLYRQKISDISSSGHGIIKDKDIYVLGAFPGDIIDLKIYKKVKNINYAEILKINKHSKLRETNPKTKPFFTANTPWEHLSKKGEFKLKKIIFKKIFKEYKSKIKRSKLNNKLDYKYYRNKIAYAFIQDNNELKFALYNRGTSDSKKTEQNKNILVHKKLHSLSKDFLNLFNKNNLNKDDIKYLILRYSYFEDKTVAHILFKRDIKYKIKEEDFKILLEKNNHLRGILVSLSDPNVRTASTIKDFYQIGDIDICEKVLDKNYYYHPSSFFQIYPRAFEEIILDIRKNISKIKEHINLKVLDLYSGVGILGISISDLVSKVTGLEHSNLSKKYALRNAEINNVFNFDFVEDSVDNVLEVIKNKDLIIVDPVRSGLSKQTLLEINKQKPEYIFYISCNPESQIRDIKKIKNNYKPIFIKQYNLFPKTHHIESLVILNRI